ncbi:hypothetical protein GCM10009677_55010 [Sphaerisporangium rubeum]
MPLPDTVKVEIMNVDLTDLTPVPRWVDTLLKLHLPDRQVIAAIEAQTNRSEEKRRRWARYLAHLHDTHQCDVLLIVTCPTAATARWARQPYVVGLPQWHTLTVRPLVLGPDNIPIITDVPQAIEDINFTVMSAVVHAKSPSVDAILNTLSQALHHIDKGEAAELAEFTESGLGEGQARDLWRTLMATQTYTYVSELRAKGREEGRVEGREEGREEGRTEGREEGRTEGLIEGEAKSILLMLEVRGLAVTDEQRRRITSCTDTDQLEGWVRRAVTAAGTEDLFG